MSFFVRALVSLLAGASVLTAQVPATPATPASPAAPAAPMPLQGAAGKKQDGEPKPVYDEKADAAQDVAAALVRAKRENKRVLIQWGANWCGWCKWLAGTMKSDRDVAHTLNYEYEVVHVDVGRFDKHLDLAKKYGAELKAIPFLTVLDADDVALVQQNTEPFEAKVDGKDGHDPKKLDAFLKQHAAPALVASEVVNAAQAQAKKENKRVFLHFGTPWCTWCHRLEDWMRRPEIAPILQKEFVDCKVDTDRMTGGEAMLKGYRKDAGLGESGGIPWFVFQDGDGAVLTHSEGPTGNTGFPYQPEDVEHFGTMLKKAKLHLVDADIEALLKSLHDNRESAKK